MSERFRAGVKLSAPDDARATVTVEADVGALRRLVEQIEKAPQTWSWPISDLLRSMRDAVSKADATTWGAAPEATDAE